MSHLAQVPAYRLLTGIRHQYHCWVYPRKAREQGWTEEAIEWASQGLTVSRVVGQLSPYIETTGPEPLSWRTQFERTRDYAEGCRVLASDKAAKFRPLWFLARGFRLALRGERR